MKTIIKQTMALAAVLTATSVLNARADQPAPIAGPEKTYTGQVVSVDPQDRMLNVKSWMFSNKEFNLGANCTCVLLGVNNGTVGDIRPGQKITVHYVDSHGVRIADLINQHPMQYEGMVTAIDPNRHMLTLHRDGMDQPIQIADGCNVTLRDNKLGMLANVQPGDHVTVIYETPNGMPTARQISQTSIAFTGKLTAIDLEEKTVKAKGSMETMKFNLANNCAIVINGRTDGKLSQLLPDERLSFSYDSINGINVVNRIAPAPDEPRNSAFSSTTPGYQSYPTGF
jgi:hypothetical protein